MLPSNYTTTMAHQFRDPATFQISPHAGQPMHHFPQHYDKSHYVRERDFFDTRAVLAQQEKWRQTQSQLQQSNEEAYAQSNQAFSPSSSSSSSSSSFSSTNAFPVQNVTGVGLGATRFLPTTTSTAIAAERDLWNQPIKPHSGLFYDNPVSPPNHSATTATAAASGNKFAYTTTEVRRGPTEAYVSSIPAQTGSHIVGSGAQGPFPDDWRYDRAGVAQTVEVELNRNTDPRVQYHIPGYAGYVRGKNFVYGDTYAKTTRTCLNKPLDLAADYGH